MPSFKNIDHFFFFFVEVGTLLKIKYYASNRLIVSPSNVTVSVSQVRDQRVVLHVLGHWHTDPLQNGKGTDGQYIDFFLI